MRTIRPEKVTGIQASQAITATLLARECTGKGQHVRLSMLDTVVSFLWGADIGEHTFVGAESERERAQSWIDLIYETRDGFITVAVNRNKGWQRFAHAAERPDILDDERFQTPEGRERFKNERIELIQSVLRDRTTTRWLARLDSHDVPCAPVLTRREMIRYPQVRANGLIVETDHPQDGHRRP